MTPRLETIEEIFHAALECEPNQLGAFLDRTCAGDEVLRGKVEALLASHQRARNFIETPVATLAASIVENGQADLLIGQTIGHYEILEEIGRGGMGAVYLAERADQQYQKRVAIKVIKRGMDTDAVLRHFRKERQILASFDHPNIARLFDGGTTENGLPYFVMEYVEGLAIDRYCDTHGLSINERLKLFLEVCAAVSYAHRHTVIHRDIKPSNILVTREGVPKLLDFGIAKVLQADGDSATIVTATGLRVMTPEYASPEQLEGHSVTAATDVYSLGMVLYQVLTGQTPYEFKSRAPGEIARAIAETEPKKPSTAIDSSDPSSKFQIPNPKLLRGDLDNVVLMALRKDLERRYQSVEQFSEDLRRHLEGLPVIARKDTIGYRSAKFLRRNPVLAAVATACVVLAVAVGWLMREQFLAPRNPPPEKSIAVLPFEFLGEDKANAYLADGIQEEILTRLSKVADLKVISRTSTQRYKSRPGNLPEIVQQLGAAHVLEGSVQKSGDAVRVSVQLINAQTDSHLWAEEYDRKSQDIFALETDIATKIADRLQLKLSGREQRAITARPTENTEAHQLYLQARHLWQQRDETALLKAIDYFNQAIAKDPAYARAYSGIADCYIVLPFYSKLNPLECRANAKAAATEALKIDKELGEAHASLAVLLMSDRNSVESQREFLRAIELDPNYANAYHWYGWIFFVPLGRFEEGIAQIKRAIELDPLSAVYYANLAESYRMARRYPEAIAQARKVVELEQSFSYGHGVLGLALDLSGRRDEALSEYRRAYELSQDFHVLYAQARAYAAGGERKKALQLLNQLTELERQKNLVWHYGFAFVYAALGDHDRALSRLEQSYRAGEGGSITYIKVDTLLDPLRGDPRFEKIIVALAPK